MYKKSLQDISYRYEKNYRFKNKLNDVKVVATQSISYGKIIRTLCGMTAAIKPEDIKIGVNDFSILTSSRTKKDLLFLGPAAYINHSCQYNTEWVAGHGEGVWCAKAIENIPIGSEITTYYGDNYFGSRILDVQDPIAKVKSPVTQVESMGEHNQDTDDTEDSDTRVGSMDVQNQPEYQTADPIAKVKSPVTQVKSMDVQDQPEYQTAVPIAKVKSPMTQVESMGEHDQDTDDAEDSNTRVGSIDEQDQTEYQTEVPIAKVKSPVTQVESMGEHNQDTDDEEDSDTDDAEDSDTDDAEDSDTDVGSMDEQEQPEYQTEVPIAKVKSPVTQVESMGEHDQPENQTAVPIAKVKSPVTQVKSMDVQDQPEYQTAVPIATVKSPVTQVESMGEHDQDTDDEEDSDTDDAEDSDTDVGSMDEQEQPEYQTEVPIAKVKSPVTQVESMGEHDQPENQTAVPIAKVKSPVTQVESMGEHNQDTDDEEDSDTDDAEDSDTDVGSMDEQEQPEYQTEVPIATVKSPVTQVESKYTSHSYTDKFYVTETHIYKCTYPQCVRKFKRAVWCDRHLERHFKNHVCPTCQKKFRCPECGVCFGMSITLFRHRKKIHLYRVEA
ncbi:uncharacterized protein LOC115034741 [Acyrthosiphon pisum]|uniref:Uncharacterized protein n=1 Tax=Acyrthosiphon pisum TaxID=7029 RepID=A0A8R2NWH7_ACYPI|nr:uncharacterized protein LOC115034741 [Acyrthosiphon pisum]